MTKRTGAYYAPTHDRAPYLTYFRDLQPAAIVLMSLDVQAIADVHAAAPRARIILRDWYLDDNHGQAHRDMYSDAEGTGKRHAREWAKRIDDIYREADRRKLRMPDELSVLGINEPNSNVNPIAINLYTETLLNELAVMDIPCGALNFGTGNPGPLHDGKSDWRPYTRALAAIHEHPGHFLSLHEYYNTKGQRHPDNMPWHQLRHKWVPAEYKGPIIITEWGLEQLVDNYENDHHGWNGKQPAPIFAENYRWYLDNADPRVTAVCPFLSDYADRRWQSFDTQPAHNELLRAIQDHVYIPIPGNGDSPTMDHFDKAMTFVLKWEGGYVNDPRDPGGETKYGISKRSYPNLDIANLTVDQAKDIYRRDYWYISGADKLAWPLCLLVFDTAVLHGPGAIAKWRADVGDNVLALLGRRLQTYTRSDNWPHFGAGWTNRMADLMREMA